MIIGLDSAATIAVTGIVLVELHKLYRDSAPDLKEVRNAGVNDFGITQELMDADTLIWPLAIIVGGVLSLALNNVTPIILAIVSMGFTCFYYHSVRNSPGVN